jgi:hypothetical protein
LLEISSRIWPDSQGWFEITGRRSTYNIFTAGGHRDPLAEIVRQICEPDTVTEIDADHYDPGLRPLLLAHPFDLRLDWWIENGVNRKSPLKLWAGQQTPLRIMTSMQAELKKIKPGRNLFTNHRLMSGRFGIDAASSWTARGLGFSPDEQNMAWRTYPATEIFAAIGLQRCRPLLIEVFMEERKERWFSSSYHIWIYPLNISVVPAAAIAGKGQIVGKYVFEAKPRSKQYRSFGWGRPWTKEDAEDEVDAVGAR